jgi:antitoxin CcdA
LLMALRGLLEIDQRAKLADAACRLGVSTAGRSEDEVRQAVREAWLLDNGQAIEAMNAWVEKNGLPLASYRQF